jgi:hypothetical protein
VRKRDLSATSKVSTLAFAELETNRIARRRSSVSCGANGTTIRRSIKGERQ